MPPTMAGAAEGRLRLADACQLLAILLWMHNGLGYIYNKGLRPARKVMPQKDSNMSIEQFIDNEVKSNDVVLFMKGTPEFPQCGFSGQVIQILDHVGVGYKGLNVLDSADLRDGIKTYSNWPTIPQLYVKGEFVGGCDIIREMFQAGELQKLFADKGVAVSAAASA
jgi:monothiol glutaredoxin